MKVTILMALERLAWSGAAPPADDYVDAMAEAWAQMCTHLAMNPPIWLVARAVLHEVIVRREAYHGDPICRACATQEPQSPPLPTTCLCGDYPAQAAALRALAQKDQDNG